MRGRQGPSAVGAEFRKRSHGSATRAAAQTRRSSRHSRLGRSVGTIEAQPVTGPEVKATKGRYATPAACMTFTPVDHHATAAAVRDIVGGNGSASASSERRLTCRASYRVSAISAVPGTRLHGSSAVPAEGRFRVDVWLSGHFPAVHETKSEAYSIRRQDVRLKRIPCGAGKRILNLGGIANRHSREACPRAGGERESIPPYSLASNNPREPRVCRNEHTLSLHRG